MRPIPCATLPRQPLLGAGAALALIITADVLVTSPASAAEDVVYLWGVARDFTSAHPDFDTAPPYGYGHYAGNVQYAIGGDGRPVHDPAMGFKVGDQWRDVNANHMAPHLYVVPGGVGSSTVIANDLPELSGTPTVDSFNSDAGPYGEPNIGPAPTWQAGSSIPDITPPTGLPYQEKYERAGGIHTLSSSLECNEFIIKDIATLRISGAVVVRANEKVDIINQCEIEILPGASFELWCGKDVQITNHTTVNMNTANPNVFRIFHFGPGGATFKIQNSADVYATILSPNQELLLQDDGQLYGTFTGKKLSLQNFSGYHHDAMSGEPPVVCGIELEDTGGESGVTSSGGINSVDTFAQWFVDMPGINMSTLYPIALARDDSGIYAFVDDAFLPIDGQMFGDDGDGHNFLFTYAIDAEFVYEECTDQFLQFEGGDGAWIFIDGELVIDLGGMHTLVEQDIHVDRLDLVQGETYTLQIFYAQRSRDFNPFRIRTTLELIPQGQAMVVSAVFD